MRLASPRWAIIRSTTSRRVWLLWIGPICAAPTVKNLLIGTSLPRTSAAKYCMLRAKSLYDRLHVHLPGENHMAVVETERLGQVLVVRMNRPERLNALSHEMRTELAKAWTEFRHSKEVEVAIFTGTGRGFCAGEDMKESLQKGAPGGQRPAIEDPFMSGALEKPVIAAVNGFAMGGGFMLVERTDLRLAVPEAVFEVSEAKRWLLGGYNHGHIANLPYPVAMEMALGFRFTAQRFYEVGFLNRLVPAERLMPEAIAMAEHLLTLPPASRVNTVHMMRQMRPAPAPEMKWLANALHEHGAKSDLMESRAAFAEKRKPNFKGWNDPEDRYRLPAVEKLR
jgi:enoyl-CoA hydratase/carnithine racemase